MASGKHINRRLSHGTTLRLIALAFVALALFIYNLLAGKNVALFNPKGYIAREQLSLIIFLIGGLVIIGALAVFMLFFTAWKYRESNPKISTWHEPEARLGNKFVLAMWLGPTVLMVLLAGLLWSEAHRLQPQSTIVAADSDQQPLTIQVVAMRWKWVFIYPEQNIATVNFVQIPIHTPVRFELTADEAPMSSFWIPNLGGQLYAMTGMVHPLNLMADTPGDYPGSSAEINGKGFAGMKFRARASSREDFYQWVQTVKQSNGVLDDNNYNSLLKPTENSPVQLFGSSDIDLYDTVVMKYLGPSHPAGDAAQGGHEHPSQDDMPMTDMPMTNTHHEMSM